MKCESVRKELSVYLDGLLTGPGKVELEEHVAQCQECRRELDALRKTVSLVGSLKTEAPPGGFREAVRETIDKRLAARAWHRRLFFPIHVKVPLEAFAAAAILAVILIHRGFVEKRPTALVALHEESSGAAGDRLASGRDTAAVSRPPVSTGTEVGGPAAKGGAVGGVVVPMPPAAEAPKEAAVEPVLSKGVPADREDRAERKSGAGEARPTAYDASVMRRSAEEPTPVSVAKSKAPAAPVGADALKAGKAAEVSRKDAPVQTQVRSQWTVQGAQIGQKGPTFERFDLVMKDGPEKQAALKALLAKWGAKREAGKDERDEEKAATEQVAEKEKLPEVLTFVIPDNDYPEFLKGLRSIGALQTPAPPGQTAETAKPLPAGQVTQAAEPAEEAEAEAPAKVDRARGVQEVQQAAPADELQKATTAEEQTDQNLALVVNCIIVQVHVIEVRAAEAP